MNQYSYSRVMEYARCPFSFKCRHRDKIPFEQSPILANGAAVHDCLRDYTLECYKQQKPQLFEQWEKISLTALAKHRLTPENEMVVLEAVKEYCEANQIELNGLAGVEEEIALDQEFKPCKWEQGFFRGIIDKLYLRGDVCKISDYKTGFDMHPDPFQLEVYAWMISKVYPNIRYFQVELDFTRFSHRKVWDIPFSDIPKIERRVMARIRQIEQDDKFEPRVSSKCEFCPFWKECPAIKAGHKTLGVDNEASAKEILERIVTKEKEVKELKEILKEFVNSSGKRIFLEDMVAEFRRSTTVKWDVPSLLLYANEHGLNVVDALSIDNRKLGKMKTELPSELKSEKVSTRFFVGKAKSEDEE